jgi:hypothetical protein
MGCRDDAVPTRLTPPSRPTLERNLGPPVENRCTHSVRVTELMPGRPHVTPASLRAHGVLAAGGDRSRHRLSRFQHSQNSGTSTCVSPTRTNMPSPNTTERANALGSSDNCSMMRRFTPLWSRSVGRRITLAIALSDQLTNLVKSASDTFCLGCGLKPPWRRSRLAG